MSQIPWVLKEILLIFRFFLKSFHYFFYIVLKFEAIFHQCFYNLVVLSNVSPIHAQFLLVWLLIDATLEKLDKKKALTLTFKKKLSTRTI